LPLDLSVNLHGWIRFDILLTVAAIVGDVSRREIDIVVDDPGTPCGGEELRERSSPRPDRFAVRLRVPPCSKPGTSVAPDRDPSSTVLQMFDVLLRDHRRNVTRPVQPPRPTLVKSGLLL
jgi:hypothetical protein